MLNQPTTLPTSPHLIPLSLPHHGHHHHHHRTASLPTNSTTSSSLHGRPSTRHSIDSPANFRPGVILPVSLSTLKYLHHPSDDDDSNDDVDPPRALLSPSRRRVYHPKKTTHRMDSYRRMELGQDSEDDHREQSRRRSHEGDEKSGSAILRTRRRMATIKYLLSDSRLGFLFLVITVTYFVSFFVLLPLPTVLWAQG